MHARLHNFTDWQAETAYLTRIEKTVYLDLYAMYFTTEQAIDVADMELLCRRLSCVTDDEKAALAFVLKDKFKKQGTRYKQAAWDREIKNYSYKHRNAARNGERNGERNESNAARNGERNESNANATQDMPLSNAERQQRARDERKKLLQELEQIGINPAKTLALSELRALHEKHLTSENVTAHSNESNAARNGERNESNAARNGERNESNAKNAAITNNQYQEPITINQETHNQKPVTNEPNPQNPKPSPFADDVQTIFAFWQDVIADVTGKDMSRIKLTPDRSKKIIARLKEGASQMDIRQAIYNASRDDWCIRHGKTDLTYICQSESRLNEFLLKQPEFKRQSTYASQPKQMSHAEALRLMDDDEWGNGWYPSEKAAATTEPLPALDESPSSRATAERHQQQSSSQHSQEASFVRDGTWYTNTPAANTASVVTATTPYLANGFAAL